MFNQCLKVLSKVLQLNQKEKLALIKLRNKFKNKGLIYEFRSLENKVIM